MNCSPLTPHISSAASLGSDVTRLPEATERDHALVRLTEAAIDCQEQFGDANVNNMQAPLPDPLNLPDRLKPRKSLGRRFRTLFSRKGAPQAGRCELKVAGSRPSKSRHGSDLQQLRQDLQVTHQQLAMPDKLSTGIVRQVEAFTIERRSYQDATNRSAATRPQEPAATAEDLLLSNPQQKKLRGGCRGSCSRTPQPELLNLSNTSTPQQQQQQDIEPQPHADGEAARTTQSIDEITATTPPPKICVVRGAPSAGHKRIRDGVFQDCRVVPVSTLYKKVALEPGREKLFLTAPSNPRTLGSPMLYDIAYENARHHMDCNRDFIRVGLKQICSNYCRPSQFRYVY